MKQERLTGALLSLLGEEGFIALCEAYGGRRLFVPATADGSKLERAVGTGIAGKLVERYGRDYVPVPLAKERRALHYRAIGCTNGEIARRLGIAEASVNRIFRNAGDVPAKGSARQLKLL